MRHLFALALLWPVSAQAGWFSYDSYEDCMLDRMKGQSTMMYQAAQKDCKKRFDVEDEITYLRDQMKRNWEYDHGELTIEIFDNTTDYRPTRGEFSFSEKPCKESKDSDFGQPVAMEVNKPNRQMPFIIPVCMKTLKLWGKYK
jgi:hypothetical protein